MSHHPRQLWSVSWVRKEDGSDQKAFAENDIIASFENGADAVVLINEFCPLSELESVISECRKRFPDKCLGVNYLGDEKDPYGVFESFRLAHVYGLQLVWTDFSGVEAQSDKPTLDLVKVREKQPESVFYASGVHFKYAKPTPSQPSLEEAALRALGFVDGVITTGEATSKACSPDKARRLKNAVGNYPIGLASGVDAENVNEYLEWVDFFLVASSIQDPDRRFIGKNIKTLADAIHSY